MIYILNAAIGFLLGFFGHLPNSLTFWAVMLPVAILSAILTLTKN